MNVLITRKKREPRITIAAFLTFLFFIAGWGAHLRAAENGLYGLPGTGSGELADTIKETDPRLHSDGPGWTVKRAAVTDSSRRRALLIGDSILSGYHKAVIAGLEGRVYVDVWITPAWQSEQTNRMLAEVLELGPYDLVHANMGLHGWPPGRLHEDTFEPLTKAYIGVIRKKLPRARIIWASTTPVLMEDVTEIDPEINANILWQNRVAGKVMEEMNVRVNDFYGLMADKLELGRGKFHWTKPAYQMMADVIIRSIEEELSLPSK